MSGCKNAYVSRITVDRAALAAKIVLNFNNFVSEQAS
jgi:hypothetical protein